MYFFVFMIKICIFALSKYINAHYSSGFLLFMNLIKRIHHIQHFSAWVIGKHMNHIIIIFLFNWKNTHFGSSTYCTISVLNSNLFTYTYYKPLTKFKCFFFSKKKLRSNQLNIVLLQFYLYLILMHAWLYNTWHHCLSQQKHEYFVFTEENKKKTFHGYISIVDWFNSLYN